MTDKKIKEGLGELAHAAEMDHEVQMARADLYKTAKYAIKLHDMLKGVSETQGLEGWVQAKITKAADYIGSVYNHLDYEMKFGGDGGPVGPAVPMTIEGKEYCDCGCDCECNCDSHGTSARRDRESRAGDLLSAADDSVLLLLLLLALDFPRRGGDGSFGDDSTPLFRMKLELGLTPTS